MDTLKDHLRSLSCTVFCDRVFTRQLSRGSYWSVSVTHTPYTRWSGSFLTKKEAETFLKHIINEVEGK